jgi:hypothetical protein
MYSNVPTADLIQYIEQACDQHGINKDLKAETLNTSHHLIRQNYFRYRDMTYIQNEAPAMGAPTSSLFSEIYLQHIENTKIADILLRHHIVGYFRYVDDILIAYKHSMTNILVQDVLTCFNNTILNMKFTLQEETGNKINFLDITISKGNNNLSFNIYRKPTTIDTLIPNDPCHPQEHKLAAIRFLINRRDTYSLSDTSKAKEKVINHILHNNKYNTVHPRKQPKTNLNITPPIPKHKLTRFTYNGKETKFITKLFKNTSVRIAYTTRNTISRLLANQTGSHHDIYESSGVYKLTCPDCGKAYIGQTGRPFSVRLREHFRDYKYANSK